jgi:SAM-dependent methyltransferase
MKLNLGCGEHAWPGWVNMDMAPLPGVDVVHDAMKTPWPFEAESFDEIFASHFLEHVPHHHASGRDGFLVVMEEIERVLKPGGRLVARVPHFKNREACDADPTHARTLFPRTWLYFASGEPGVPTFYTPARFDMVSWRTSHYGVRGGERLKVGKWGLTVHLHHRIPFLRPLLRKPWEAEYVLQKPARPPRPG